MEQTARTGRQPVMTGDEYLVWEAGQTDRHELVDGEVYAMAGAEAFRDAGEQTGNRNAANMAAMLQVLEMSWGDVALMLSVPRQGLGNAAISSVATPEQLADAVARC